MQCFWVRECGLWSLQRNIYNDENVEHYDYNPEKAKEILENAGCTMMMMVSTREMEKKSAL